MPWSRDVFSTMAREISYDEETSEMIVTWKNGKRTAYSGVPEDLAIQVSKAASVGQIINFEIKGQFPFRNV